MSGNVLLTSKMIAREMTLRLAAALNFGGLVHKDHSEEFKKVGDTVMVKNPATFVADEFDGTIKIQPIIETEVPVKMDITADISVEISSKDLTLSMQDFTTQFIDGAVLAVRDLIDRKLAGLYKDIPYYVGEAGQTPNDLRSGFTDPMLKLNINRAPQSSRAIVFDPMAQAELLNVPAIVNAEKSNSDAALREGYIGRIMGFDTYMNQNVATHITGTFARLTDVTITSATKGVDTIGLTSVAGGTEQLLKGDAFTLDGQQYVVKEDTAAAVGGVIGAVKIYPAIHEDLANIAVKTVSFAANELEAYVANLAFHKNAFSLVSRPMELPMGGASGSYVMTVDGISVRVTMGYDMHTKKNIISIDALFGVTTLQAELATVILG